MAARPYWSGQIRLALVSIPVQVFSATRSETWPSFHQIHEPSGKRIRYQKVAPGVGPVENDEIVKGYEVEKGKYVLFTEQELDGVKLEARKVIDLVQFVDQGEVGPMYFDKPYYVAPEEGDEAGRDAYVVLRDALRKTGKLGLGQLAVRGRIDIVGIKPYENGILLETIRYPSEIKKADPFFTEIQGVKPEKDMVALAVELIERKAGKFDPSAFKDKYADAVQELIEAKLANRPPESIEEPAQGAQVIDLMEALKRSIGKGAVKQPANDETVTPMRRKAAAATARNASSKSTKPGGKKKKATGR
jgi:DNA end-binding protein Ku